MTEFLARHGANPNGCYIVEYTSVVVPDPADPEARIPGLFIKFYGTKGGGDFEKLVRDYPGRIVIAATIITFYYAGQTHQFVGNVFGNIVTDQFGDESRGENGFGWNKQFCVSDKDLSYKAHTTVSKKYQIHIGTTFR